MQLTSQELQYTNISGDENYSPKYIVEILLSNISLSKGSTIWCPFDTEDSEFYKVLSSAGYRVICSHIHNGQDFYQYEPTENYDAIISNPPFQGKANIVERCLQLGKPFAMLLPVTWLNDRKSTTLFIQYNKQLQLLIPDKRTEFISPVFPDRPNRVTFKSVYYGVGIFKHDITLLEITKTK